MAVFAIQAVSRIEYVTLVDVSLRRSLLLSGKLVSRAHFVNTSIRRVLYSVSPILAQSRYAQLGHNTMIGIILL